MKHLAITVHSRTAPAPLSRLWTFCCHKTGRWYTVDDAKVQRVGGYLFVQAWCTQCDAAGRTVEHVDYLVDELPQVHGYYVPLRHHNRMHRRRPVRRRRYRR